MYSDGMEKQRTLSQNAAMHVYFAEMSQLLNESGLTPQLFLQDFDIDYTPEMIKNIWRKIGEKKFGKNKTSQFTTAELQQVYEEFNRQVTKHGFVLPFPSYEALSLAETYDN